MTNLQDKSIEDYIRLPLPGWAAPSSLAFSPDDRLATYLLSPDRSLRNDLYAYDPDTKERRLLVSAGEQGVSEQNISREEALRRERMRQMTQGITSYAWDENHNRLLIPLRGSLYVKDSPEADLRLLYSGESGPAVTPLFSPDGEWVAFVRDAEVWVIPYAGGEPRQVTSGAQENDSTHGLAEFVAQEEMGRRLGFWWAPDSQRIAFEEASEAHIPVYTIMHQGMEELGEAAREDHHYPFAGGPNARVRLGVVSIHGGEPVWMDLGDDTEVYLGRVDWFPDGALTAQLINRDQNSLVLRHFDPATGKADTILMETSPSWVNLHDMLWPLKETRPDGGAFLWASERSGYRHLYLLRIDGSLVRQLTSGDWMVDALAGVDEGRGQVYFTAARPNPVESQLFAVSLEAGELRRITKEPGMHAVVLDHACRRFLDSHNSLSQPPHVTLRSLEDGAVLCEVFDERDPRVEELALQAPELVELRNRRGDLLYGAIYRPPASFGTGPYPTLVSVYGGPHAQMVTNGWALTSNPRAQYLSRQGFLVFMLDNRGSARRGLAFESALKHHMGTVEVEDQVDGVRWLAEQGLADPQRVGIYGWSYGGYMTLMCLARAPETFKAGVAGAPVTAWDGYDTFYTERYMGTPQSNPDGYHDSSVMAHVDALQGELMLVHGLIDENVHFRHTARLINALIKVHKEYRLLIFPEERHSPRSLADQVFMEENIRDFFLRVLK